MLRHKEEQRSRSRGETKKGRQGIKYEDWDTRSRGETKKGRQGIEYGRLRHKEHFLWPLSSAFDPYSIPSLPFFVSPLLLVSQSSYSIPCFVSPLLLVSQSSYLIPCLPFFVSPLLLLLCSSLCLSNLLSVILYQSTYI